MTTTSTMSSISLKPHHHHNFPNNPHPKLLSFHFIRNPNLSLPFNTPNSNSLTTTTCRLQFSSFPSKFYRHTQRFRRCAYDSGAGQKLDSDSNFDFDYLLAVGELVCLISSAVVSVIFAMKRRVFGAMGDRVLVLAVAMLALGAGFGTWIRKRQWRRVFRESVRSSGGGEGLNWVERVEKLEEDLRSSATMIRVLSGQLEKLGIRFRVTRKALKEPIAESGGGEGLNLVERVEKLEEDLRSWATMIWVLSRQLEKLGIQFWVTRKALKEPIAESGGGEGLNLVERVEKLEEDLRSSATMIRVLSRQLEKLGIQFWVTRKALKEPIAEEQQQKQLDLILVIRNVTSGVKTI